MNCEEAKKLLEAYVDNELDVIASQQIEKHLESCGTCEQAVASQRALAHSIQHAAPYYRASSELRDRIQASLRKDSSATPRALPPRNHALARRRSSGISWNWLALAAAIVVTAIGTFSLSSRFQRNTTDSLLATQLIASHVRSLMANHLTDVASSDQHTVKPWLDEKLDFAAPVVDLAADGFPLVGGRLDYLDHRAVAALVYQRRKHFINLFVWPAEAGSPASNTRARQGYHLLHWTDSDFNYWAVSDVNPDDLQTFRQLFEKQLAHR
jgi:anti-sigma factor RsiW